MRSNFKYPPLLINSIEVPGGRVGLKRLAQTRLHASGRLEVIRLADQRDRTGGLTKAVLDIFACTDRTLAQAVEEGVMPHLSAPPRRSRPKGTTSNGHKVLAHASYKQGKSCKGRE